MNGGSQWVKTDIDFGNRMAWLWISDRLAGIHGIRLSSLTSYGKPEEIEKMLYAFMDELRPDLSGCTIFAIKYDLAPMRWKILVAHPSLPAKEMIEMFPEQPLVEY